MIMPNFLIIGAAKSGTTTLYNWLDRHPQIYMCPVKETNFFALENVDPDTYKDTVREGYSKDFKTTLTEYQEQFTGVSDEVAIGEASPSYLYYPQAVSRIKHYLPDVKLIAVLRNPVERAYSNFVHHLRDNLETTTDFSHALELEEERIKKNWWWGFHYLNAGFYSVQLKRYLAQFDRSQIKIYLFEDLINNSDATARNICQFLQVDDGFKLVNSDRQNVTGIPKNRSFYNFLTTKNILKEPLKLLVPPSIRDRIVTTLKNKTLQKPQLSPVIRSQLIEDYREEILELQELINRDLSGWLN